MTKKLLIGFLIFFFSSPSFSYLPSAETIIRNNANERLFLKGLKLSHKILFPEFQCEETLYFTSSNILRTDFQCHNTFYTLLRTQNSLKQIYNQKVNLLTARPLSFLPALLLLKDEELLFSLLSHFQFISAEKTEPKKDEDKKAEWTLTGMVSLVRTGKIEKGTQNKLERNVDFLLTSPTESSNQIWFDKNLFLPQKIQHEETEILFQNYREIPVREKRSFRYPQKVEIQKGNSLQITIETLFDKIDANPSFEKKDFDPIWIAKNQSSSEGAENIKETLEKFISEYR